jgi:hypothetical protein
MSEPPAGSPSDGDDDLAPGAAFLDVRVNQGGR